MVTEGIERFWEWWASGRSELEAAIAAGGETDVPERIGELVEGIHPDLEWQLAAGREARHSLALSANGDPNLRHLTEAWLRSAPPADATWEYHAARVPVPAASFTVGEVIVDPDDVVVGTEPDELYEQLDVTLGSPALFRLDEEQARQAALYLLDAILGEDDVERWVGIIEIGEAGTDGVALAELPDVVSNFARTATRERWEVVEEYDRSGLPAIITVNRALKLIDHLDHVFHLEIVIEMNMVTELGMPTEDEAEDLEIIEEDAVRTFGGHGSMVARETEDGIQRLHFFLREAAELEDLAEEWAADFDTHGIEAILAFDPDWSVSRRWT